MLGLIIYGIGAICFWPCAKFRSFAGFCVSTFVIGLGLGTLEMAANPYEAMFTLLIGRYIAICGPMEYSSIRLNLSQSFAGIGSIVGPLIASHAFFGSENTDDLSSVQWVLNAPSRER